MAGIAEEKRRQRERYSARGEPIPHYLEAAEAVPPGKKGQEVAAERMEVVEPYLRELREHIFGAPEAPFRSLATPEARRWEAARLERRRTPADRVLDEAVRKIADGTGFAAREVYEWILTGSRPALPRVVLRVEGVREQLPDGTTLRRKWATLVVHVWPITEAEMRRAWRLLRAGWRDPAAGPDFAATVEAMHRRRSAHRALTTLDRDVLALVDRMPAASWAERAAAWGKTHSPVAVNTLRVRYHRARTKREQLSPSSQED